MAYCLWINQDVHVLDTPTIEFAPEAPRDPTFGHRIIGGVPPGSEDWRDGRTDDGEQDSEDALADDEDDDA